MNTIYFDRLFLLFTFSVFSAPAYSQTTTVTPDLKNYKQQVAFVLARGIHTGYRKPATYTYQPTLFAVEWQRRITKKEKRIMFDYVLQPQVNTVRYKDSLLNPLVKGYTKSWEAGVNINLLLHTLLFYNAQTGIGAEVYLQGGSGPHYVHASPARQAKGFIFSDNIFIGFRAAMTQRLLFDIRGGLRHLSNASLKKPNLGLDNVIVGAGIRLLQ